MTSTDRLPFAQWADINRTDRFISVEPLSGYRRTLRDDGGYVIYLAPDTTDHELGRALLECLGKSRFIWPPDEPQFFDADRIMQSYRSWQKDVMRRYGHKTKREAYKAMDWRRVERSEVGFRFSRTNATSRNIGGIFRRVALSSFRRRSTRSR